MSSSFARYYFQHLTNIFQFVLYVRKIMQKIISVAKRGKLLYFCNLNTLNTYKKLKRIFSKIKFCSIRFAKSANSLAQQNPRYNSVTTHQRNLQLLMIEIFKTKNNHNPTFMKGIFAERDNYYSLREINHLQLRKVRTTIYGTENI